MPFLMIILITIYAALGILAWYWRSHKDAQTYPIRLEQAILAITLLLHGVAVVLPVAVDRVLIMGWGYAVSVLVWLILVMYFAGGFFYRLRGLQLLLYPLSVLFLTLAMVFPGQHIGYQLNHVPFLLHIIASLLAYSLFALTAVFAILILWLSHSLHTHRFRSNMSFLPPLLSLEKLMFQGMWIGFILLTLSLVSGTFFAESLFGQATTLNHKTIFGVLSWLIYASLLLKRSMTAWRGKRVAVWTLLGFISLMLAYIGSKFALEVLLA